MVRTKTKMRPCRVISKSVSQDSKKEERRNKQASIEVSTLYVCMEEMKRSMRLTRLSFATATERMHRSAEIGLA
jgi:hypothetical protein